MTHTLGLDRGNDPAVVRYLQDRLNVLSRGWGRSGPALPGLSGRGVYDQATVNVVIWARQQINARVTPRPFTTLGSSLLGSYGYDRIVYMAATMGSAPPPRSTPPTTRPPVSTPRTPPATPSGRKPVVPTSGSLLGMFIAPRTSDWSETTQKALWNKRQTDAGRRYDIGHNFYPWTSPFPTWRESFSISQGRIPMVSWNGTTTDTILSGQSDAMIRQRAGAMRDLHSPVFLRFYWEMDGAKKASWTKSPAAYIAAWRHVHQIFAAEGASNVAWVWCPNAWAWDISMNNAARWYPGDDVVDWICSDGYNWSPTKAGSKWTSFETIYRNFYNWASAKNKPLMVGEMGAMEGSAGHKAQWIADTQSTLKTRFPKIKAVVYFDENKAEDNTRYDWRLDSSASTYAAWNHLARDPYFNQR